MLSYERHALKENTWRIFFRRTRERLRCRRAGAAVWAVARQPAAAAAAARFHRCRRRPPISAEKASDATRRDDGTEIDEKAEEAGDAEDGGRADRLFSSSRGRATGRFTTVS